jgi:hypothetical protein
MTLIVQPSLYRCDVCGREWQWKDGFRRSIFMITNKMADYYVDACSDACAEKFDALPRRKQISMLMEG